jgi:hypothetical protein
MHVILSGMVNSYPGNFLKIESYTFFIQYLFRSLLLWWLCMMRIANENEIYVPETKHFRKFSFFCGSFRHILTIFYVTPSLLLGTNNHNYQSHGVMLPLAGKTCLLFSYQDFHGAFFCAGKMVIKIQILKG